MKRISATLAGVLAAGLIWALPASAADPGRPAGTNAAHRDYPYPNGQAPVDTSAVAEVEINHPNPQNVIGVIGAVGDPFTPISFRFNTGVDIIRSHHGTSRARDNDDDDRRDNGRHNGWNNPNNPHNQNNGQYNNQYGQYGSAEVNLSNVSQWFDGRREFYLRLSDPNGQAGQLRNFVIRTSAGSFAVRNVPAYFGSNRQIEARVTPRPAYNTNYPNGYPYPNNYPYPNGTGYPYPNTGGYPYPNTGGYPYPNTGGVTVTRTVPQTAMPGQQVRLAYQVQFPYGGASTVDITENLPPSNWQIVRFSTQPTYVDNSRRQVTWRFTNVRNGMNFYMDLVVPQINGWQMFRGTVSVNGQQVQDITGMDRLWVGNNFPGYPNGYPYPTNYPSTYPNNYPYPNSYPNNYPYPDSRSNQGTSVGTVLRDIFGLPTG